MKTKYDVFGIFLLLCFFAGFISCDKDDSLSDQPKELKLSVTDETVYTDGTEYFFDIVSGNGNYQVKVDGNGTYFPGKATLTDNHVKVDLVTEYTQLTITDGKDQTVNLLIVSTDASIKTMNYSFSISYGSQIKTDLINFGAGKYEILQQSGGAAEVSIDSNDRFTIKSVSPGYASFLIADQRGTTNGLTVYVQRGWDLTSDQLTVQSNGHEYLTFPLKYGEGGWKIVSPILNDPQICVLPKNEQHEYELLQVYVWKETKEPVIFTLEDKAKNRATITINIE